MVSPRISPNAKSHITSAFGEEITIVDRPGRLLRIASTAPGNATALTVYDASSTGDHSAGSTIFTVTSTVFATSFDLGPHGLLFENGLGYSIASGFAVTFIYE